MKYFLDTEFIEGKQKYYNKYKIPLVLSMWVITILIYLFIGYVGLIVAGILAATISLALFETEYTPDTIDLISIGIVSEDKREYYAISKDFNIKEAFYRYDIKSKIINGQVMNYNEYWIRENVLFPIFIDYYSHLDIDEFPEFTYKRLKKVIKTIGKSNREIAQDIIKFCRPNSEEAKRFEVEVIEPVDFPSFYAYYGDYDWVVFCWIFGRMIQLPKGFPMYCIDLKQMLDEEASKLPTSYFEHVETGNTIGIKTLKDKLKVLKLKSNYPKQVSEHNALADAKWNFELYKFLRILQDERKNN